MSPFTQCFFAVTLLRYLRFFLNFLGYWLYTPFPIPDAPTFRPDNVVCIIPSVTGDGEEFERTVRTALSSGVKRVYIPVPETRKDCARETCSLFGIKVKVLPCKNPANKRRQVCEALRAAAEDMRSESAGGTECKSKTKLILMMDDHVWAERPREFLRDTMAPFEDPSIGGVAVGKKVKRVEDQQASGFERVLNFIARNYLKRHNWGKRF
jgi:hypothetical protein